MTFCIGWKDRNFGYIVSDSAVTGTGAAPREVLSSFGEVQRRGDSGVSVEQAALKIFVAGGPMTFAGNVRVGQQIVRSTRGAVVSGVKPLVALQGAVQSVMPLPLADSVSLIAAYHDGSHPLLVKTDTVSGQLQNAGAVCHAGSLGEEHVRITKDAIEAMVDSDAVDPIAMLASVLAMVQSYGIHFNLVDQGVGGRFSGALTGPDAAMWQPDILYLFYNSVVPERPFRCVSSTIRGGVHIVESTITNDKRCFTNLDSAELDAWKATWLPDLTGGCRTPEPGYVAFVDGGAWRVVLLDMAGKREHPDLKLDNPDADPGEPEIGVSAQLRELLYRPLPNDAQFEMRFLPRAVDAG